MWSELAPGPLSATPVRGFLSGPEQAKQTERVLEAGREVGRYSEPPPPLGPVRAPHRRLLGCSVCELVTVCFGVVVQRLHHWGESIQSPSSIAVLLNLGGRWAPVGGVTYQVSYTAVIYIRVSHRSKFTVKK